MLNGKFYTGLTPKMMDRNSGAQNRLESHLFWPDDSKTESATESRLKRRTSFLAQPPRDESTLQRRTSWCGSSTGNGTGTGGGSGDSEINTKQRFHKEFANSSIQFCDNIQEEETTVDSRNGSGGRHAIRKPLIRKTLKQDIAIKPTAMNMKLPSNHTAQEEYAAIKKNQALSSKIKFYDYVDDTERQNNKLRPKMDMNDKKDVERNTKNSPKLQVKGIVRNFRMLDEHRNNDFDFAPERNYENYVEEERREEKRSRNDARILRGEQRNNNERFNGRRDRDYGYRVREESPVRNHRDHYDDEYNDDRYDRYDERRAMPRAQSVPKKILKNSLRDQRHELEEQGGIHNDLEYVERSARNMRINTSPKKHVTYGDEIYEYEAYNGHRHIDIDDRTDFRDRRSRAEENIESGKDTYGSSSRNEMKSTKRSTAGNTQRQQHNRANIPDYEAGEEWCSNDRMVGSNVPKKSLSSNKNTNTNNNNNTYNNRNNKNSTKINNISRQQQQQEQQQQQQRKITPKISSSSMASTINNSTISATTTTTSPLSPTMEAQKHLRSSLCFSGGEIVANNHDEVGSNTPTSESSSRRTARSAATTRRVCVGLPD